jgi:D-aspartate ligase
MSATAVVMNMFYTGLGIARTLNEKGIPVIGLTSQRGIYGSYTRYATIHRCPDSRHSPNELVEHLIRLGVSIGHRAVLFPTRDDDVVLLHQHRAALGKHYSLVIPPPVPLTACLNKWETHCWAHKTGISSPRSWVVSDVHDVAKVIREATFPGVMKPLSSYVWRQKGNWAVVGGRKVIPVSTPDELMEQYKQVAHADCQVLFQEMVPGDDTNLFIAGCYLDRDGQVAGAFTAHKLLQDPPQCGTGCIVETVERPEVAAKSVHFLQALGFTGIAEVEMKWDAVADEFKLIEVNPRPWDQHSLGKACGVDVIYLAYCEHAGLPLPVVSQKPGVHKWVAEDALCLSVGRALLRGDLASFRSQLRLASGKRIYAIWSWADMRPFLTYMLSFLPRIGGMGLRYVIKRFLPGAFAQARRKQEESAA